MLKVSTGSHGFAHYIVKKSSQLKLVNGAINIKACVRDDLRALYSTMQDKIQAAIRAKGSFTKC